MDLNDSKSKEAKEIREKLDGENEFDHAVRYIRYLLRLLGIWALVGLKPTDHEYTISKRIWIPFVSALLISLTIPVCYYVITVPIGRLETIFLLGPITFHCSNIFTHYAMVARSNSLKICVEHIKLDWRRIENSEEHDIMRKYARFSHALTVACLLFMYTSGLSVTVVVPLWSGNTINEMNETIRPRPFPGTELLFNVQASVVYEIVFVVNVMSIILHFTVSVTVCLLAIVFICHACGQIQVIIASLNSVVDRFNEYENSANVITDQMIYAIRKHVRLLKFTEYIDDALKEMMLMAVGAVTLIICFVEYDILITMEESDGTRVGTLSYILLFISFAFNLFLYCQFGETLKGQCEQIGKVAYLIDWLRLPGRTKLALIMIINVSNQPCTLTAGGMMELSRVNFAGIIKTSFAYFNMMRTMG